MPGMRIRASRHLTHYGNLCYIGTEYREYGKQAQSGARKLIQLNWGTYVNK